MKPIKIFVLIFVGATMLVMLAIFGKSVTAKAVTATAIIPTPTSTLDIEIDASDQSSLEQIDHTTLPEPTEKIEQFSIWTSGSYMLNYAATRGVPKNTLVLLLMLPIIATIVVFTRQVIGIETFGIYIPSIITIAFLAIGIRVGLIMFIAIILAGALVRYWLRRVKILSLPRMATVLLAVSLVVLSLILISAAIGSNSITGISIFPILIMIILVERFIDVQIERGSSVAVTLTIETILISSLCYLLMSWHLFQNFIFLHPGYVLILIPANLILGRWTGLRLSEYIRFKTLRERHDQKK